MIRLISFDLWGTLVAAPRQLPQLLVNYFAARTPRDPSDIGNCLTSMSHEFDRAAVRSGRDIPSKEKLLGLAQAIGVPDPCAEELESEVRNHVERAPPYLIEPAACADLLRFLKRRGIGVVFASNSGFVSGATMRKTLESLNLLDDLSRCVFSDQLGRAKPNIDFFRAVAAMHDPATILHIGDNAEADVAGARAAGMATLHYVRKGTLTDPADQIESISTLPDLICSYEPR